MRVEGHIHIGEANRWASEACKPLRSRDRLWGLVGIVLAVAAVLVAMSAASAAADALGEGWVYPAVLFPVIALLVLPLVRWLQARSVARFRRGLVVRGVPDPLPWMISLETEGLMTRLGGVETRAAWSAISEIFPVGPYWVLLVQGSATFVPKRHFADDRQELAFVRAVLDQLTPEARHRSDAAEMFARA